MALVAAMAAVAVATTGGPAHPDTPAAAVDRLLGALAARDVVGLVEALAPEERAAIGPALPDAVGQLQRIGLLGEVDLDDVAGVEVVVDGPRYEVHQLDDRTAAVDVVAGRLEVTGSLDTPLSATADAALQGAFGIDVDSTATRDFAQRPLRIVVVERDGAWHPSLGATLLDDVLTRFEPPEATTDRPSVVPAGADTPEAAVAAVVQGWADGSLEDSLAVLDPEQAALAYAWSEQLLERAAPTAATVHRLDLAVEGGGSTRTVTVTGLDVEVPATIDVQRLVYDGTCFRAERRFAPELDPWATFETCDGDPPPPSLDRAVDETRVARGGEDIDEAPSGLGAEYDLDEGVRLGPPAVDRGVLERQASAARRRPRDNPISAVAVFGGGADLPTFVVVERDGRWYVQPTTTLVRSLLDTAAATDPDAAEVLVDRVEEAFRSDEPTRVILESRDPDNVLYGSATAQTSPLVAACFRTVLSLEGELAMVEDGTACVRQLEADGRLDGQPVPALLGAADCLMLGPTSPPAAEDPIRRFYLTALARRGCVADKVAAGELPAASLDEVADPATAECYAPYVALRPEDPEAAWAAADQQVAACTGLR